MTFSTLRSSLTVLLVFSAVALGTPHAALAQSASTSNAGLVTNPPADAQKTASGLVYKIETPGSGTVNPSDTDLVKVATSFWTTTTPEGKPGSFGPPTRPMQMSQIILPGLKEGLGLMTTGEKMRMWLPEKLAFAGATGKPAGPLMIDVVLLDIIKPLTVPTDVAAPPADATKTKSGLYSKVIAPGTGTVHPKGSSQVTVHYSGWTTDGQMFDSSVLKGAAATFPLNGVISGWTEGVQLMVVGETRRFWIPEKLAYQGAEGKPKGMLVFDVQLLAVDGKQQ
jgi:FKBP-type peptidyl-prolyl cis-trans isomerase